MGQGFSYKDIKALKTLKVRVVGVSTSISPRDLGEIKTISYLNRSYFKNLLKEVEYGDGGTIILGSIPHNFIECELLN